MICWMVTRADYHKRIAISCQKKCRAFVTVFDHYCHAVSSPSAEIERRPPATQLFNINRTSRVFFYTFEELRCGPPGAQSVRVSRNHRFLCRRPAPLGLPSSPLAIQCPYIKSAPWPASAPWPSNAPLISSTLSGYGALTGYSALLVSVPLHVTVLPTRLQCAFRCQKNRLSGVPAPSSAPWPY